MVLCLEWVKCWSIGTAPEKKKKNVICRIRTHDLSIYIPKSQRACWSVGHRAERFQRVPHALLTMVKLVDFISCKRISRQLFSRKIALKWIKWEENEHFSTLCEQWMKKAYFYYLPISLPVFWNGNKTRNISQNASAIFYDLSHFVM